MTHRALSLPGAVTLVVAASSMPSLATGAQDFCEVEERKA